MLHEETIPSLQNLGSYIKYVGEGRGVGGFYKFFKKHFKSSVDHRRKFFMAQ